MKRTLLLLSLLASTAAFANDVDPFGFEKQAFESTKSAAEVRAETLAAKRAGEIQYGEVIVVANEGSTKSRQEVKEELSHARAAGEIFYGDAQI